MPALSQVARLLQHERTRTQRTAPQHTATHCNTRGQHTATHCNTKGALACQVARLLQHERTKHCNTTQRTATHCNTLQHTATQEDNTLQHERTTHGNTTQHTATHRNKLQHKRTTRCNTLQHARRLGMSRCTFLFANQIFMLGPNVSQCIAACCSVLQSTSQSSPLGKSVCCSVLQRVTVCCGQLAGLPLW